MKNNHVSSKSGEILRYEIPRKLPRWHAAISLDSQVINNYLNGPIFTVISKYEIMAISVQSQFKGMEEKLELWHQSIVEIS